MHAKHVAPDPLVWASAALAEGLGIRAVARRVETDPHTVLGWWGAAAAPRETCTRSPRHALQVAQVQRDALCALLSAVTEGVLTEAAAIKRLARSPHGVGVAMDPVGTLSVAVEGGDRPLALAQRLVHPGTHVLAPEGAPLLVPEGCGEYRKARVTPDGQWMHPERRQDPGRWPKPRGMPTPGVR